jgi:hypothetical protein
VNGAGDTHRPELLSQDRAIQTAAQLLVEGRTPEMFFREFVAWLKMDDRIQVRTFGGVSKATLKTYLEGFSAKAAFKQQVTRLAIIRDAEHRPASEAYESVRGVVQEVLKVEPGTMGVFGDDLISLGIFILPDCSRSGMLESLCLEAWAGEQPVDGCPGILGVVWAWVSPSGRQSNASRRIWSAVML